MRWSRIRRWPERRSCKRSIEQYGAQAQLCRTVSIVRRDLPLPLDCETSRFRAPADADLYKLYAELEFKTLLAKLQPPVDLPLFETEKKLEGHYRSFAAAVDPPEFVRLAAGIRELAAARSLRRCRPRRLDRF